MISLTCQAVAAVPLLLLLLVVLPRFVDIYREFDVRLPAATQWTILVGRTMQTWGLVIFPVAAGMSLLGTYLARHLSRTALWTWTAAIVLIEIMLTLTAVASVFLPLTRMPSVVREEPCEPPSAEAQGSATGRTDTVQPVPAGAESGRSSRLQFRLVAENGDAGAESLPGRDGRETYLLEREVLLDGSAVVRAQGIHSSANGAVSIELELTASGAQRFADVTRACIDRSLAIVFDGKVVSAPRIRAPVEGGKAVIAGAFSFAEMTEIVDALNLPPPSGVESGPER